MAWKVSLDASDTVSVNEQNQKYRIKTHVSPRGCLYVCVCLCVNCVGACVYLQVVVVPAAAAVALLGHALVHVEHGAKITEKP